MVEPRLSATQQHRTSWHARFPHAFGRHYPETSIQYLQRTYILSATQDVGNCCLLQPPFSGCPILNIKLPCNRCNGRTSKLCLVYILGVIALYLPKPLSDERVQSYDMGGSIMADMDQGEKVEDCQHLIHFKAGINISICEFEMECSYLQNVYLRQLDG